MPFRVLVIGGRNPIPFALLRDTLDDALIRRLPDVEILTAGGRGIPALAASYATARGLPLVAMVPDFIQHPGDAIQRRDELLVSLADAVVVVPDAENAIWELLRRVRARRLRIVTVGAWRASAMALRRPIGLPD
jgi:YspA, cpYpsA-related SLOG family